MSEPSAASPTDDEAAVAALTLESHWRGFCARQLADAASRHRPLFRLHLSLVDKETGLPVHHQPDGARFGQPHTLKVRVGRELDVRIEIDDLGRTISAVRAVEFDTEPMALVSSEIVRQEGTGTFVYRLRGSWTPRVVSPTPDGERELVLLELSYVHGVDEMLSLFFHLQLKLYAADSPSLGRGGEPLAQAICRYDGSSGHESWSFRSVAS